MEASLVLLLIFGIYGTICLFALADYIIYSLGLYGVASKRGISLAGLAWLPVGNLWVIGAIVDSYEQYKENHFKKWKVLLPVMTAVAVAAYIFFYVAYYVLIFSTMPVMSGMPFDESSEESVGTFFALMFVFLFVIIALFAVIAFVMVAMQALNTIALYKMYENISPKKAIKYTLLSLIVPLARGICLLKSKKLIPDFTPFSNISQDAPVENYEFNAPNQIEEPTQETEEIVSNAEDTIPESNTPEDLI